jgi:hypothetical protein
MRDGSSPLFKRVQSRGKGKFSWYIFLQTPSQNITLSFVFRQGYFRFVSG